MWDGRQSTAPFVGASVVSKMADVAVAINGIAVDSVGAVRPSAPAVTVATSGGARSAVSMAVLESLLVVLVAGESAATTSSPVATGDAGGNNEAIVSVREEGLRLLLSAFVGCGEGRAAGRLWNYFGAPALAKVVSTPSSGKDETSVREGGAQVFLQAFLDGAVEHTRWVMEGGIETSSGEPPARDEEAAERAATLALALVYLERAGLQRTPREFELVPAESGDGASASRVSLEETAWGCAPVLWRLGLTRPSVWQSRRVEAFGGVDSAAVTVAADSTLVVADVARSCVASRWARRWECTLAVLRRLPSARARLALLREGVASGEEADGAAVAGRDSGVAGAMLQEIITAGVIVRRASGFLEGKGYGGLFEGGDGLADLPQGFAIPSASATAVRDGRGAVSSAGHSGPEEFGVGLPSFRGLSGAAQDEPTAIAAVAAAGVIDAALAHLSEDGAFRTVPTVKGTSRPSRRVAFNDVHSDKRKHPFSLLFPQDLWRVAFETPTPVVGGDKAKKAVAGSRRDGKERGHYRTGRGASVAASAPATSPPTSEDVRLHALLVSALTSAVDAMAEAAAGVGASDGQGKVGAWRMSSSAEVSSGLLASVVGGAFMLGFGLGDEANRCVLYVFCVVVLCSNRLLAVPSEGCGPPSVISTFTVGWQCGRCGCGRGVCIGGESPIGIVDVLSCVYCLVSLCFRRV